MGGQETDLQDKALYEPLLWRRFIDDIFFLWTHIRAKLEQFYQQCNLFDPNIKFEQTVSDKSIPFLDVLVILKDGKIETDLYSKPTDTHQYLNWTSCHPRHTKASIPYIQALRLRCNRSKKEYFENRARDLNKILLERGYKNKLIKESIMSARRITREQALTAKTTNRVTNRVTLVVTFNPAVPKLRKIVNQYQPPLHTSSRCKEIFSSPPLIVYRRERNLTQILTSKSLRSSSHDTPVQRPLPTLPAPTTTECDICGRLFNANRALNIHRSYMHKPQSSIDTSNKPGFWPCKRDPRCACCKCYGVFKETITSTTTNETITLKQHTNCNTPNVIYLLTYAERK